MEIIFWFILGTFCLAVFVWCFLIEKHYDYMLDYNNNHYAYSFIYNCPLSTVTKVLVYKLDRKKFLFLTYYADFEIDFFYLYDITDKTNLREIAKEKAFNCIEEYEREEKKKEKYKKMVKDIKKN